MRTQTLTISRTLFYPEDRKELSEKEVEKRALKSAKRRMQRRYKLCTTS